MAADNKSKSSYKSKSGKSVPLCWQLNEYQVVHGRCMMCECGCCKFDCNFLLNLTLPCRQLCKIPCDFLKECEGKCQAFFQGPTLDIGPEIGCKSVGAEITCHQSGLENSIGVWHFGNILFPELLPSILFPCCCFGICFPLPLGEDNAVVNDEWSPGPSTIIKMKLCKFCISLCSANCGCCKPYTSCSTSGCGLFMEPAFNGALPCWFCTEFQMPYFRVTNATVGPL